MSNPWFRHYCGMMRDEKLVAVAVKAKQSVERVVWVWGAILESASGVDDGGKFEFDAAEAAYFLRADEADILAIVYALEFAGRIVENRVVKWGDRQFQSDKSALRQAEYRKRKQLLGGYGNATKQKSDAQVTSRDRQVTPQDTDTDTEVIIIDRVRENPVITDLKKRAKQPKPPDHFADLEKQLREAAGWEREPHPNLSIIGPVAAALLGGVDLDLDLLPTAKALGPTMQHRTSWNYIIQAAISNRNKRLNVSRDASDPPETQRQKTYERTSKPNRADDVQAAANAVRAKLGIDPKGAGHRQHVDADWCVD